MPPPNNPEVCRFTLQYLRDTRTFENVFHVRDTGGWNVADMTVAAQTFRDWWDTQMKLQSPNVVGLKAVFARLYDPSNPLAVDLPVSPPIFGNATDSCSPANVTSTLSFRTGLAGRKFRGRVYVPGYTELQTNTDDTIGSGLVTRNAIAAGGIIGIWPTGQNLVVFHRATNTFTPITTYIIENIIDSQRRRLPARGR
jgi:hypothetical protein